MYPSVMGESCIAVSAVRNLKSRPAWHVLLHQILSSVLWRLPVLPDAHPQSKPDVTVQPLVQPFHASDSEVAYPSSDKLVQFIHLIGITYSPASACQLAVQLCTSSLPARTRDFHPLERAHGAQTKNSSSIEELFCHLYYDSVEKCFSHSQISLRLWKRNAPAIRTSIPPRIEKSFVPGPPAEGRAAPGSL